MYYNNDIDSHENDNLSLLSGSGIEYYPIWMVKAVQQHLIPNSISRSIPFIPRIDRLGVN
jgi:hypothetical protein